MSKLIYSIAICLFYFIPNSISQELPKHTIFVQTSISLSNNSYADGTGISFGLGYQKHIWKDRLRFIPSFTFGKYTSKGIKDAPNAYFNTISIKNNINFDVIKKNPFSLFIGTGFTLNYTSGLIGQPKDFVNNDMGDYFNQGNFTLNAALGFRIQPEGKMLGYEIHLFNTSFENKKLFSQVEVFQVRVLFNISK